MASDLPTVPIADAQPSKRRGRFWPAVVIVAVCVAAMAFFQAVTIIDRGHSNAFTAIAFGVMLVALAVWTIFFSPLSRNGKWWAIAVPTTIIALLFATLRTDGTTSQLVPRFTWRWIEKPDEALATKPLETTGGASALVTTDFDFPGFLGARRDAYVLNVKLATDWEKQPPKLLWKQPIGAGWSAFSVVGDAAFTLEQRGEKELVTCYDAKTGRLKWYDEIEARHHNDIGGDGPSSTPEVREGRVYALGATGVLRCLDAATGKRIWIRDVLADVGTTYEKDRTFVNWGRAASPLIVDDLVIVPGGGPASGPKFSLIAYDRRDGEIVWKRGRHQVSYSSPSLATYGGVRQVVIVNEATISGHNPDTGNVLWETKWDGSSSASASASQTVPVADERFFVSKGYSMGGGALFELKPRDNGRWTAKKLWHNRRALMTKLNNVVVHDGYVYGPSDGVLQCVELESGKKQWEGGESVMQVLRVGDLLLVTGEWGSVSLVALDPAKFNELARFQALNGSSWTWNNPALAGPYLLVRNAQEAACYEVPLAE